MIWHDVISSFGELPIIWVDLGRSTKLGRGKLSGEHYFYNLSNIEEKYPLSNVSMQTALDIYNVDISDFSKYGELNWHEKESRFYYKILYPNFSDLSKKHDALVWETEVKQTAKKLRELVGNHVLSISHEPLLQCQGFG